ncbi:MAG: hypothetical protein R2939_12445 [Kofleriaceae bacterium]
MIGPIDADSVARAAAVVGAAGVPLLSLAPRPETRRPGRGVFHVMHSAEACQALARRAAAAGVTRFAILAPESGYGRAVSAAFAEEVARLRQGRRTAQLPADDALLRERGRQAQGQLAGGVADQADQLELIAPAPAAGGLILRGRAAPRIPPADAPSCSCRRPRACR